MRVCGCVQIEESGLFYPVVLPNFQRVILGEENQVARIAPNGLRFFPFWASAMYFQLHLIAIKLRMCNLIRNHASELEANLAEIPATMRVCGNPKIEYLCLFYPVVLPDFQRENRGIT